MPEIISGVERREIGHGIHVTKSDDGVFIHFKLSPDRGCGFRVDQPNGLLGQATLHDWAIAVLGDHDFDS